MTKRQHRKIERWNLGGYDTQPLCPASGKIVWPSEVAAQRALHRVQKKRKGRSGRDFERHYYPCRACHGWHLTHLRRPPERPT